ncbi:uncharacterized protein [Branchiostoma lanceolatum]|uniref:uncharacterized protein n=1 Tax=Branchiostoma lanceolatum TaxID=7740 RepID=UPI003455114F
MADCTDERDDTTEPLQLSYYCVLAKDKSPLQVKTLLELKAQQLETDKETKKRLPFRFVAVIDESGSMESTINDESLIDKMKVFAELLVKSFQEDDLLGIVGFDSEIRIILPITKMDKDGKANAAKRIENIRAWSRTNLSDGIISGVELFKDSDQESHFRNGIIVFTDGVANEGICDADGIVAAFNAAKEASFSSSVSLPISTFTIGGYRPDLLYEISQRLGSDSFFWINDFDNFEADMMIPVYLRETSLVTDILVNLRAINGVTFDIDQMKSSRMVDPPDGTSDYVSIAYYFHDISADMFKHIPCYLNIPDDYEDALGDEGIMEVHITYRDFNNIEREINAVIPLKLITLADLKKDKCRKEKRSEGTREKPTAGDKREKNDQVIVKKESSSEEGRAVDGSNTSQVTGEATSLDKRNEGIADDEARDGKNSDEDKRIEDQTKKTTTTIENGQSQKGDASQQAITEEEESIKTSGSTQEVKDVNGEEGRKGSEQTEGVGREMSDAENPKLRSSAQAERDLENMSMKANTTCNEDELAVTSSLQAPDEYIPTEMELQTIAYMSPSVASELDEVTRAERTIAKIAQEECRTMTVGAINISADFIEANEFEESKTTINETKNSINQTKTHVNTILSEEAVVVLTQYADSMIGHLDVCFELVDNPNPVMWQKMKAMASSIANESPTSGKIFHGEDRPFAPPAMKTEMQKYKKIVQDTKAKQAAKKKKEEPVRPKSHAVAPVTKKTAQPVRPKTANKPKSPETVKKLFKEAKGGTKAVTTRTFKNTYFTLSERLVAGRTGKKSLEPVKDLIIKHGGTPVPFIQNSILVCTKEEFEKKTAKVRDAKANKTPIVFEEFIYDSIKAKKMLDIEDYRFW